MKTAGLNHELRRTGLTATDMVSIFCGGKYAPPYYSKMIEIYSRKLGVEIPKEDNELMKSGRRAEHRIAKGFEEDKGIKIVKPRPENGMQKTFVGHEEWMLGTPDYLVRRNGDPVECKNVRDSESYMWGDPKKGEEPAFHALIQLHWQIFVLSKTYPKISGGWIAALIGGWDERYYRVERNVEFEHALEDHGRQFWFEVIQKKNVDAIPVDDSPAYSSVMRKLYPTKEKSIAVASDEDHGIYEEWLTIKDVIAEKNQRLEHLKNTIWNKMKNAELMPGLFVKRSRSGYVVPEKHVEPTTYIEPIGSRKRKKSELY